MILSEPILLHVVANAIKNGAKTIEPSYILGNPELFAELSNYDDFLFANLDSDFYDKANIMLNNFEEELNNAPLSILDDNNILTNGIVFTPLYLSRIITTLCSSYVDNNSIKLAGDISSGMGSFIYALNQVFPNSKTLSVEKDPTLFNLSSIVFSSPNNSIINSDALRLDDECFDSYDIIVGNPPYVRIQNLNEEERSFIENDEYYKQFLFGSYDLSVAFLANIIRLLKDGGVAGLILSRKLFSSAYGEKICEYLKENAQILEIIDFGDNQLFKNKTTYTLVILFKKCTVSSDYRTFYSKIPTMDVVDEHELLKLIRKNRKSYTSNVFESYPWNFVDNSDKRIVNKLKKNGEDIKTIFSCVQGFRTGNNKAFLINSNGSFTRPYLDGKCIGRCKLKNTLNIIWPYYLDNGVYKLISEQSLIDNNPIAYEQLVSLQDPSLNCIFEYSRPQNLFAMDAKKILVKEMMPRAEFWADLTGNVCFGSGYALIPVLDMDNAQLLWWSYILSTEIMEYQYRILSTNLHSGWFRMFKGHIENIYLPKIDFSDKKLVRILKGLSNDIDNQDLWKDLNSFVSAAFKLDHADNEYISEYLDAFHKYSLSKNEKETSKNMKPQHCNDNISDTKYPELSNKDRELYYPIELTRYNCLHEFNPNYRVLVTFQKDKTSPIQRWYKYTQGYSTVLVSRLLQELEVKSTDIILDPFCGSGTTLLAAKLNGNNSIGCDVSPLSCWVSRIKTYNWSQNNANRIAEALQTLKYGFDYSFKKLQFSRFFEKAFYPEILAQTIHIRNWIFSTSLSDIEKDFLMLALISIQEELSFIRKHGSHYRFLNDNSHIGVNKLNIDIVDVKCDVSVVYKNKVQDMLSDISIIEEPDSVISRIICSDILSLNPDFKADIVITSPPYLNRNNYFSQQKIELSLLNLIQSEKEYSGLVKQSFCSHVEADLPSKPICRIEEVNTIIEAVMRVKSNNAKIPHMIAGYFNDIDSFFERLPNMLNIGAKIAFVVGNCRWNGVVVPVDHLVCKIAEQYGFVASKIIVARMKGNSPQQMQEYGKIPVRESIVILHYTGKK